MSALTIFTDTEATLPVWHSTDAEMIRERLNAKNVRFERWAADRGEGLSELGRDQHARRQPAKRDAAPEVSL